jgi:hypothetical protein
MTKFIARLLRRTTIGGTVMRTPCAVLGFAVVLALTVAANASGGQPVTQTLNPPPLSWYTCYPTGRAPSATAR